MGKPNGPWGGCRDFMHWCSYLFARYGLDLVSVLAWQVRLVDQSTPNQRPQRCPGLSEVTRMAKLDALYAHLLAVGFVVMRQAAECKNRDWLDAEFELLH